MIKDVQSNFNGSNTFGTMKISSRQGLFEAVRFDYSTRSGGIIGLSFRFSLTSRYFVCSHKNRLIEAILMSTHNIQGLTNPLPGRPGQAPNWAGQVLFPARRPAGQVKENFKSSEGFTVACIKGQLRRYLRT